MLKFVGDGVLAVFPADHGGRQEACQRAARAVRNAFSPSGAAGMRFVAALHVGPVVYGNIGSPDRLDFTVVGPTVNYLSRLEGIAKSLDRRAVCSREVAGVLSGECGDQPWKPVLKGFAEPQEVFELQAAEAGLELRTRVRTTSARRPECGRVPPPLHPTASARPASARALRHKQDGDAADQKQQPACPTAARCAC